MQKSPKGLARSLFRCSPCVKDLAVFARSLGGLRSVMKGHCKNLVESQLQQGLVTGREMGTEKPRRFRTLQENLLKNDPSDRLAMRKGGADS